MPGQHNFEHLPLLRRYRGNAKLRGGGRQAPQTVANKQAYLAHGRAMQQAAAAVASDWSTRQARRQTEGLPVIPGGVPVLLQIDPSLDLDALREKFEFEVVAEQEEGYVIVASRDVDLRPFVEMAKAFAVQVHGSGTVASVHRLYDDEGQVERLRRILSERLLSEWATIADDQAYVVDVGISCTGTTEIPPPPERGKRDMDADWARKQSDWAAARAQAYNEWDDVKAAREAEIIRLVGAYQADILQIVDGNAFAAAVLPDSFTVRLRIPGRGFRDFVLNYPFVFEVVEPDDIALPQRATEGGARPAVAATPTPPPDRAPAVCVIDSGIQEAHVLLQPAIDRATSRCFLPGKEASDVADAVRPGGHGTRVAGAVLYGEIVAKEGAPQLPFWVQNARVLDEHNRMPVELFPPEAVHRAVEAFHRGARQTRIFNHSINANGYCRTRYMSAWAAEIDLLCSTYDVLLIQSAGNLSEAAAAPYPGMRDHVDAGREYPAYLYEPSSRVANPAQSLQALTVGSIAYGGCEHLPWKSVATEPGQPSAFSRAGFGIWSVVKPEVVEHGGDATHTGNAPCDMQIGGRLPAACPELVRSTMYPPGPAYDRDEAGTSFAAPKVTRIAARLQSVLPDEPALLYRALIVQSAQWPSWAEAILNELRRPDLQRTNQARREHLIAEAARLIRCLGYGWPDEARATGNSDHRTTFITAGETPIKARECHIYQVPIPPALRNPADEFDIRIDVTLSYVAQPRRTRRNLRRYLSTWVDWKSSKLGERIADFRRRAMTDAPTAGQPVPGNVLPWTLHENADWGHIRGTRRSAGTAQKDWAVVKSNALPEHFCIAVVGHQGWSRDPDSAARYTMAVTFEILGREISIYEPLRAAVTELQAEVDSEADVEVAAAEVEAEVEAEAEAAL